jgi:hypothetical protein
MVYIRFLGWLLRDVAVESWWEVFGEMRYRVGLWVVLGTLWSEFCMRCRVEYTRRVRSCVKTLFGDK